MMSYLNGISSANLTRLKLKYHYVFRELEYLMCYIYELNAGMKSYNGIQVYCKYLTSTTTNIQASTSIQQFTSPF